MTIPTSSNVNESDVSRQSYDPDHFAPLFEAEDRHFWFRSRNAIISALTEQIVAPLGQGYRVLEVGCGTGNVLRRLSTVCTGGLVIGMDLFIEGLAFARTRTSAPLVQGDVYHSPFSTEFDMIGLFDVVEHIEDDERVFSSLHGLLKPGGSLFVTVPAHMSLWSYFDTASHHCRRYEIPELTERLARAGFEIEYVTEFMTALYPLVWLGRRVAAMMRGPSERGRPRPALRWLGVVVGVYLVVVLAFSLKPPVPPVAHKGDPQCLAHRSIPFSVSGPAAVDGQRGAGDRPGIVSA